jgi:hypothetical protein
MSSLMLLAFGDTSLKNCCAEVEPTNRGAVAIEHGALPHHTDVSFARHSEAQCSQAEVQASHASTQV